MAAQKHLASREPTPFEINLMSVALRQFGSVVLLISREVLVFLRGDESNVDANNEGFVYFPLACVGSLIIDWCSCMFLCSFGKLRDLGFLPVTI